MGDGFRLSVIDGYDNSLRQIVDEDELKKYDGRVELVARLFFFILTVAVFGAAYILYFDIDLGFSPILFFASSLFEIAVAFFLGLWYKHAANENDIERRFQIVVLALLCLLYGGPMMVLLIVQLVSLNAFSSLGVVASVSIVLVLWFVALTGWGVLLDRLTVSWVSSRFKAVLNECAKPFHKAIALSMTESPSRTRTLALSVCMFFASFVWALLDISTLPILVIDMVFIAVFYFLKRQPNYMRYYNGVLDIIDMATFCLRTSEEMCSFGIHEYDVLLNRRRFKNHVSLFTIEIYPDNYEPLMLIYSSRENVDYDKITSHFNEQWRDDFAVMFRGNYECPFRSFQGRVIVDSTVRDAEKLLWRGGDSRVAVVVEGSKLRDIHSLVVGDFTS